MEYQKLISATLQGYKNPFDIIDMPFETLSDTIHVPADQLKMVFCLLISFPMGFIFRLLKPATVRHSFAIIFGLFFEYLLYRNEVLQVLLTSAVTYSLTSAFSKARDTGAKVVFGFNLLYLSCYHLYSMWKDYGGWNMDISVVLMMNVAKHTSFAWCYKDGAQPRDRLSEDQNARKIEKLPSFFEYMSYIFFYAGAVVGPAYDFREYNEFINLSGDFSNIPGSLFPALLSLLGGFLSLTTTAFLGNVYNVKLAASPEFLNLPWWRRVLFVHASSFLTRVRYFTAWNFATANCIMSGFSYNGKNKDGGINWNRVLSVRVIDHELGDNIRDRLESWNTSIQIWLKRYVFYRICREDEIKTNPKKAAFASNVTFMVSAFWHGFYPSYYFVFFHLFLTQQVSKSVYSWKEKFRFIPPHVQTVLRWYLTAMIIDYLAPVFQILEYQKSMAYLKSTYFIPSIIVGSAFVFFSFIGNPKKKTDRTKTAESLNRTPDGVELKKTN